MEHGRSESGAVPLVQVPAVVVTNEVVWHISSSNGREIASWVETAILPFKIEAHWIVCANLLALIGRTGVHVIPVNATVRVHDIGRLEIRRTACWNQSRLICKKRPQKIT